MSETEQIRILIVDDHSLIREGMKHVLESEPGFVVVGLAADGDEAIRKYREMQPDVCLMDVRMPGRDGIAVLAALRGEFPGAKVMMLSTSLGEDYIVRALENGAASYLTKDTDADELIRLVRQVKAGRRPLPAEVASRLAENLGAERLSTREREVLELVARGLRNKEVAAELGISEQTAQTHVRSILSKLNVNDRTEAVTLGFRRGIIDLET